MSGHLGIDLSLSCFSHRLLYVALSRATHPGNVYTCTENAKSATKNLVYPEVLSDTRSIAPKFAINSVRSVDFISHTQTIAPLSRIDNPNLSRKTKNIDIDADKDI